MVVVARQVTQHFRFSLGFGVLHKQTQELQSQAAVLWRSYLSLVHAGLATTATTATTARFSGAVTETHWRHAATESV